MAVASAAYATAAIKALRLILVRQVDATFGNGAFRPLKPVQLAEGTRVRILIEEEKGADAARRVAKIHSPKLVRSEDVADFVMEVRENRDAGV